MPRNYVAVVRRHRLALAVPVLVCLLVAVVYAFMQPRNYIATATVFADNPIPSDTSVGTTGADKPPSGGQLALFNEQLASRSFLVAAAKRSPLAGLVATSSPQAVDAALSGVVASVTTSTPGPQLLKVDVKQGTPALASGLGAALVDEFLDEQKAVLRQRSTATIAYDQAQTDSAAKALALVQDALRSYISGTPNGSDPVNVSTLSGNVASAQQQYVASLLVLAKDQGAAATIGSSSVLHLSDEPDHAVPASRLKLLAAAVIGGTLVGLCLAALLAYVLLRAGARRAHRPESGPGTGTTDAGRLRSDDEDLLTREDDFRYSEPVMSRRPE